MPNTNIVQQDISSLLDGWIQAEQNGVQFPVPFEAAWRMAGYSTKANAKREIKAVREHARSSKMMNRPSNGASGVQAYEDITFSLDGFKDFCLLAKTEEGYQIRQYFIEAEKKWRLVQQIAPAIADEVEILHLKIELAKIEAKTAASIQEAQSLRHYVVTALPKATADRILGVTEVTEVITKEVVVNERGQVLGHIPGESLNKREICERYELVTKSGNPDYKQLNAYLGYIGLPPEAWDDRQVVTHNPQLKIEYLPQLDKHIGYQPHQKGLGE